LNFNNDESKVIKKLQKSCDIIETYAETSSLEERWVSLTENFLRIYDEEADFVPDDIPKIKIPISSI
jgi:hypothetical protein